MSITEKTQLSITAIKQSDIELKPSIELQPELELQQDIDDFKKTTLEWAKDKLDNEGSTLETKEVKDLASIVDSIEKSIKPQISQPTQTVNILVQNLMEAKDDC